MTDEQKQFYLAHNGLRCPFCHSEAIDAGDYDSDEVVTQAVSCDDCGKEWTDYYKLSDVSD